MSKFNGDALERLESALSDAGATVNKLSDDEIESTELPRAGVLKVIISALNLRKLEFEAGDGKRYVITLGLKNGLVNVSRK
jgi:hypothetical protein